ncbi:MULTISPECIES: molybdopterin converting factor subunit 1 [Flavobacteriaceae]|uniref:Molybdopterin synthase sulfur carrier subunit n=2 Tax=Flavobacteriaceae TaxID=49546 RepID=A0A4Y8APR4_9FLAO|nr:MULTISPECIES: molybdopterin converting factor subunit 1 [Flavobacteriaceae]TEW72568.1 molybdopterin converting factor subunit 1 [Gramella jeungdoensis]GGK54650.1 molybdopterin synthase sulfur carrier subunit [Lutibacter litoralis]
MEIQLLFFGITTDIVGVNKMKYTLKEGATVGNLKKLLIAKYSALKNINDFAIAINEEYVKDTTIITKNDIVAIIPPVSGG